MPQSLLLTAQQLARLGVYQGWQVEEVASFLSRRLGYLPAGEAARVAHEAAAEWRSLDEGERARLDEEARRAEHDLSRRRSRKQALAPTPANERAIGDALEAATVFHGATGLAFEALCDLIEGAFLLPRDVAALIAEEAIEQSDRLDERTR